jgi:hypothetical protein
VQLRRGDVTESARTHLGVDVALGRRRVRGHVRLGLRDSPPSGVQTRVHDEPAAPKELRRQAAHLVDAARFERERVATHTLVGNTARNTSGL